MRKFKVVFSSFLALCLCMASSLFTFASAADLAAPTVSVQPFFVSMPQLPDGYFDGDILANGDSYTISLDFSNLSSSISGSSETESQSFEHYTFTVPNTSVSGSTSESSTVVNGWWNWVNGVFWNAMTDEVFIPDDDYWDGSWGTGDDGDPSGGFGYTEQSNGRVNLTINGVTITGQTTNTQDYISEFDLDSDFFGSVSGSLTSSKDTSDHSRFRAFSLVRATNNSSGSPVLYYWFVVDARCVVSSEWVEHGIKIHLYGSYPKFYNFWNIDGRYWGSSNLGSSITINFSDSTISPNQYGIWLSDNFPPPVNVSSSTSYSGKFLVPAIFAEDSLLFSYLNSLHSDLNTIHSDLTSLNSSMQSAISNQTNTLVNTNTPGNFDQTSMGNTDSMLSLQDSLSAPSTDTIFSSGNTFTDGMGFWRDRMNELLFPSNSPITALTIFSLTLGLAVLIIGRRVNGGGTA